jgi:hypothetical protein
MTGSLNLNETLMSCVKLACICKNTDSVRLIPNRDYFLYWILKRILFIKNSYFSSESTLLSSFPLVKFRSYSYYIVMWNAIHFQLFVAETLRNEMVLSGFCIPSIQAHSKHCNRTNLILENWLTDMQI